MATDLSDFLELEDQPAHDPIALLDGFCGRRDVPVYYKGDCRDVCAQSDYGDACPMGDCPYFQRVICLSPAYEGILFHDQE